MTPAHRVAIVGAGIGAEHLAGYLKLPDRFEVSTICDLDLARAKKLTAPETAISITDDFNAVLNDPHIDLIDICLPPHLHVSTSIAAMEAGKHVICEKPLATSLAEADKLAAVSEHTGKTLFPVFQCRFGLAMAQIEALRNADLLGRPYAGAVQVHWNRGTDYYAVPWRGTWEGENGGAILSHAIHAHDLAGVIVGPIAAISARVTICVNPIEVEDCAAIIFETRDGALITSSVTLGGADDMTNFRFCFEKVTMQSTNEPYAPCKAPWSYRARDTSQQGRIDQVLARVKSPHAGFAGFFQSVADQLDNRPNKTVTLADGRHSLELVCAIYQSSRTGEKVKLPLRSDHPYYSSWRPLKQE